MDVGDVLQAAISFVHRSNVRAYVCTNIDVGRTYVLADGPHAGIAVPLAVSVTHEYLAETERYFEIDLLLMFVIGSPIVLGQVTRVVEVACGATTGMEKCFTLLDHSILLWYLAHDKAQDQCEGENSSSSQRDDGVCKSLKKEALGCMNKGSLSSMVAF